MSGDVERRPSRRLILLAGCTALLVQFGARGVRAEPAADLDWRERPQLTGSWGGRREALAERGIVPDGRYTAGSPPATSWVPFLRRP